MTAGAKLAQPLRIGGITFRNRVFLAPMSGVTDQPMRQLALSHGAGLAVAEMVPGAELAKGKAESQRRIRKAGEAPHMVQLAGRQPELLAEGARVAAGEGADVIDINMGCPAKKVTGGYCGSALMRDPELAARLIDAVVCAVDLPVTVKMRLGWDDASFNAPDIAQRAQSLGVSMITVHGRTRCQFYKGSANWSAIAEVKRSVSIPVVLNGDILDSHSAAAALTKSNADALMVGRAHYGAPWAAGSIAQQSTTGSVDPSFAIMNTRLDDYVSNHYEAMLSLYGTKRGVRHARKHLGWYFDKHAGNAGAELRTLMMTETQPDQVFAQIRQAFAGVAPRYNSVQRQAA